MFAIFCRRGLWAPLKDFHFVVASQDAVFFKLFSSGVCENASQKSFGVSYLVNSCGLSSKDAISVSEKVCFKSPENPDAVLKLLREYGFTDAHIPKIVTRWPGVLSACPNKNLLPKLEFFCSIGVPISVLVRKLSVCPHILKRSLKKSLIPSRDALKDLLQSDERVVQVFSRSPRAFRTTPNISVLRERGVPESSIITLITRYPHFLILGKDKLVRYMDRVIEMGFDASKIVFIDAVHAFSAMSEMTLKRKMEVHRRCGWSDTDITAAFLKYPNCLKFSDKKIMAAMDFVVSEFGCKPVDVARQPVLLGLNVEKRMKPRRLVARILNEKGLLKKTMSRMTTLVKLSEAKFLKRYIVKYEKDIPELLDMYVSGKAESV